MRKFLAAATLTSLFLIPAAARADIVLEASVGQGYQVAPTPRGWERLNLEITPGYAPSLPVLSWFRLQLGIVTDFPTKSGSKTDLQLRPMISIVPPVLPIYGRLIFGIANLMESGGAKREITYGAAVGVSVGLPSIAVLPGFGVFAEVGALPRKRDYPDSTATGTESKLSWVAEGRAGAYLKF